MTSLLPFVRIKGRILTEQSPVTLNAPEIIRTNMPELLRNAYIFYLFYVVLGRQRLPSKPLFAYFYDNFPTSFRVSLSKLRLVNNSCDLVVYKLPESSHEMEWICMCCLPPSVIRVCIKILQTAGPCMNISHRSLNSSVHSWEIVAWVKAVTPGFPKRL